MRSFFTYLLYNTKIVFYWLIGIDLFILSLHLLFGSHSQFFHLDFEQNLPTFYQSFKLVFFGIIFFILGLKKSIKLDIKSFILPLSLVLIFLGLDELLQIHENIYRIFELFDLFHPSKIVEASMKMGYKSSLWILYYLPFIFVFIFWSGYWLRYFQSKMRNNAWILVVSSLCLFTVLLAEIFSSTGSFAENTYYWLITIEETAEMILASTLILAGSKMLNKHIRYPMGM
jgi:hypothetical protein